MNRKKPAEKLIIYQSKSGKIEFRGDFDRKTIWGTQKQIAAVFSIDRTVVTKHINKILKDKEVDEKSNVQKMHIANSDKPVKIYSLDILLAVGYRTNSAKAIEFRKWATKVLKQHLIDGYTINKKRLGYNYKQFMQAITDVKAMLPAGDKVKTENILELIRAYAGTWISLEAYDSNTFPKSGKSKKSIIITAAELSQRLQEFKKELIAKKQATDIFGQERSNGAIKGIVGNVFQSAFGKDAYPSVEEKATHLLYFIVKDHPFIDGNKRSGALAFVWFLRRARLLRASLTPEALTTLTLLIAESQPKDKDKMVGLVLLLLKKELWQLKYYKT